MRTPTLLLATALLVCLPRAAHAAEAGDGPVRDKRRVMLGLELGWNGLAGLGLNASYNALSRLAFDAGVGLSGTGLKTGLRARVNLLTSEWTPFLGAGILYGFGLGNREVTIPGNPLSFKVGPSPFAQLVAGVAFNDEGGFTLLLSAGYAALLRTNITVTSGPPDATSRQAIALITGGGLSLGVTLGYSF
jgi:hypothetical protein